MSKNWSIDNHSKNNTEYYYEERRSDDIIANASPTANPNPSGIKTAASFMSNTCIINESSILDGTRNLKELSFD